MENIFTENDYKQIEEYGISLHKIEKQLHFYNNGIPKVVVYKPATLQDGIIQIATTEKAFFYTIFKENSSKLEIEKFVPASGAASRMFKFLSEFLSSFKPNEETVNAYINRSKNKNLEVFFVGLKNFPFYTDLLEIARSTFSNFDSLTIDEKKHIFVRLIMEHNYFNYAAKPKGILPFHLKNGKQITPVEEHLEETNFYKTEGKKAKIHFTITKEFQPEFEKLVSINNSVEATFSYQYQYTDTIAVKPNKSVFRLHNNSLFFRPGGHGALIENLNQLQSDIVFIKNIDNVSQNYHQINREYKQLLGGFLIHIQEQVFHYLTELDNLEVNDELLEKMIIFAETKLYKKVPDDFNKYQKPYKIALLKTIFNRPIRVCGMVKNEGEPGGGPFWVKNEKGEISLQIVEQSQIDATNIKQQEIFNASTHFNPVDIVCGVKNYKGEKFNLLDFVDENTGFITEKTKNGEPILAFELPGLWNGAMANWNTIFVEVPLETFNPVKTVNDLLKPSHQPNNE
ncbi:DUF4301 family protein [Flavobacterium sp.]|uniref:DUF4301 family protein n=1 Tax=Flavobacterium sp. TaxID=239 RepID=UPI003528A735